MVEHPRCWCAVLSGKPVAREVLPHCSREARSHRDVPSLAALYTMTVSGARDPDESAVQLNIVPRQVGERKYAVQHRVILLKGSVANLIL
jgi:hypothetical protein